MRLQKTTTRATARTATADDDNENDDHGKGKARDDDDGRTKDKIGWNQKSRLGDNGWAPAWPREKHGVNTLMWPGQQTSSTDQRGRQPFSLFCCVYGFL